VCFSLQHIHGLRTPPKTLCQWLFFRDTQAATSTSESPETVRCESRVERVSYDHYVDFVAIVTRSAWFWAPYSFFFNPLSLAEGVFYRLESPKYIGIHRITLNHTVQLMIVELNPEHCFIVINNFWLSYYIGWFIKIFVLK